MQNRIKGRKLGRIMNHIINISFKVMDGNMRTGRADYDGYYSKLSK